MFKVPGSTTPKECPARESKCNKWSKVHWAKAWRSQSEKVNFPGRQDEEEFFLVQVTEFTYSLPWTAVQGSTEDS